VVAVTTVAGAFDVLNVATGQLLYQYKASSYSTSSFADVDGSLVTADADGFLYDLAPRGGNGAAPTTAVTSPRRGSAAVNRTGRLTIRGTASGTSISRVEVAVQSGGPDGPWWDGHTATWIPGFITNPATLANPGAAATSWSLTFPFAAAGGSLRVLTGAVQSNGIADVSDLSPSPGMADAMFTVDRTPGTPMLTVAGSRWVAPGAALTLAGTGFTRDETVVIKLGRVSIASAVATGTGGLPRTVVRLPTAAPFGPAVVSATDTRSRRYAAVPIQVSNEWAQAGHGPTDDDYEPNDPVFRLHSAPGPPAFLATAWSYGLGATVRTSLSVWHGTGYVGDDAGVLTALSIRTGKPVWTATEGSAIDSTPAVSGADVVFGTDGDSVVAVNARTGAAAWTTRTTSAVRSGPAVSGGDIYVGSDNGSVYRLAASNGAVIWRSRLGGAVRGSPAVDLAAHTVVVGDAGGAITALSARTGRTRWTFATGGVVTATPSIADGVVYVGSGDGVVYALSERRGTLIWSTRVGAAVSAGGILTSGHYVVGDQAGHITTLAQPNGAIVVVRRLGSAVVGLAGAQDWIAATTAAGEVWGIKSIIVWEADVAPFASAPTVVDGVVYTATSDGTLAADTVPGTPIP
jgi:outer membrane protein assembly factor BamB